MSFPHDTGQNPSSTAALMTVNQIAALLGVSDNTVYYWVERREIPFIRVGRHLRFIAQNVIDFFSRKTAEGQPGCHGGRGEVKNESPRSLKSGASARTRDFASEEE